METRGSVGRVVPTPKSSGTPTNLKRPIPYDPSSASEPTRKAIRTEQNSRHKSDQCNSILVDALLAIESFKPGPDIHDLIAGNEGLLVRANRQIGRLLLGLQEARRRDERRLEVFTLRPAAEHTLP